MRKIVEQGLEKPIMKTFVSVLEGYFGKDKEKKINKSRSQVSSINIWVILCLRRRPIQPPQKKLGGFAKLSPMNGQGEEGKASIFKGYFEA